MGACYITGLHVNKIFHLQGFDIPISGNEKRNLILTGANGTGKTILVSALARTLQERASGLSNNKLTIHVNDAEALRSLDKSGQFIYAFYQAARKVEMKVPKEIKPYKLKATGKIEKTLTSSFLNYLVHLKTQESFSRGAGNNEEADRIKEWFESFTQLLRSLISDNELTLKFDYSDYSFTINSQGKAFTFNDLSDGYAAMLDIIVDMIMRMHTIKGITSCYDIPGIVIIDEIETHLHLALQQYAMRLLAELFPNIQFIVTTHSPLVLTSVPEAVVFDMASRKSVADLSQYSYSTIAETYFGVPSESSYLRISIDRYIYLCNKPEHTASEAIEIDTLENDIEKVSPVAAPELMAQYYNAKLLRP